MKKKAIKKKKSKQKQKIDVVLDKLADLERQIGSLVEVIKQLRYYQPYFPPQPNDPKKPWNPTWPDTTPISWDVRCK